MREEAVGGETNFNHSTFSSASSQGDPPGRSPGGSQGEQRGEETQSIFSGSPVTSQNQQTCLHIPGMAETRHLSSVHAPVHPMLISQGLARIPPPGSLPRLPQLTGCLPLNPGSARPGYDPPGTALPSRTFQACTPLPRDPASLPLQASPCGRYRTSLHKLHHRDETLPTNRRPGNSTRERGAGLGRRSRPADKRTRRAEEPPARPSVAAAALMAKLRGLGCSGNCAFTLSQSWMA